MGLNETRTLEECPPKFLIFASHQERWLAEIKERGIYPGPASDLDFIVAIREIGLTDMNTVTYICDQNKNQWCLHLYSDVVTVENTPDDVVARLNSYLVDDVDYEDDYVRTSEVECIIEAGERHHWVETTQKEIASALEDCDGDHDKAREQLLDEAREYYQGNHVI